MVTRNDLIEAQKRVLIDSDYYPITDDDGNKSLGLGNGGCLKLAAELGYTQRIINENCVEDGAYLRYETTVEVLDAEGKPLAQDVGSCDTREKPDSSYHNLRALSKTRAWQRALKNAAMVLDRLASDLGPRETIRPAAKTPDAAEAECSCDPNTMPEPLKHGGIHMCGSCKRLVSKRQRLLYMSTH